VRSASSAKDHNLNVSSYYPIIPRKMMMKRPFLTRN